MGTPARSSSAEAAASASCRGSFSAPGSGSAGGSTTIVARPPRVTSASSGSPARGSERVAHGRAHVGDRLAGRRRPQHDRIVRRVDDGQARAEEQRDALHYGIDRYSRRNARRKPRCGQKREAQRFVIRQSVVITG